MYLKRLEVRGFKSFASATRFDLEPGITAIVGPNGSGKSNVVDALAWVMGEQGARALRGGKMEDVIFAGTSSRPALGRAQVSLTIDNSDQVLPIEYTEVTISRTLFRSGASEYAINGNSCRLLDIQELLSDTGMGRQMHVIVGQGQLDRILQATPEDRRSFVEEAAGVLKYRRRKEKTERKLTALEANLVRLTDLTKEVGRQLTPLGRQAKTARRAQVVQAEVRDAKLRLAADELYHLDQELTHHQQGQERVLEAHHRARAAEEDQRQTIGHMEERLKRLQPELKSLQQRSTNAATLIERFNGLVELSLERQRHARSTRDQHIERAGGRGGQQRAIALREDQLNNLSEELEQRHRSLQEIQQKLTEAEELRRHSEDAAEEEARAIMRQIQAATAAQRSYDELVNGVGLARIEAENALVHVETRQQQLNDLPPAEEHESSGGQDSQLAEISLELTKVCPQLQSVKARLTRLDKLATLLTRSARAGEQRISREQALVQGLMRELSVISAQETNHGTPVADLVRVESGWEAAAGALFNTLSPLRVLGKAAEFWSLLSEESAPLVAELHWPDIEQPSPVGRPVGAAPIGLWAADLVHFRSGIPTQAQQVLAALLSRVVFVENLRELESLTLEPGCRLAVSKSGEVLSGSSYRYHSQAQRDPFEVGAELEAARGSLQELELRHEATKQRRSLTDKVRDDLTVERNMFQQRFSELRAEQQALQNQFTKAEKERAFRQQRRERAQQQLEQAQQLAEQTRTRLQKLEEQLTSTSVPDMAEPDRSNESRLNRQAQEARELETELMLRLRTVQSESQSTQQQVHAVETSIKQEQRRFQDAHQRAIAAQANIRRCLAVNGAASDQLSQLRHSHERDGQRIEILEEQFGSLQAELDQARSQLGQLQQDTAHAAEKVHRMEMAEHDTRQKADHLIEQVREEFGMTPDFLIENYGPEIPVPITELEANDKWAALRVEVDEEGNPLPPTKPFDRAEQQERLRRASKDLAALGKFNPLALEEFSALQERHDFLSEQLSDLEQSKKDLLALIRDVDQHVERVFQEAFVDTAREFEQIFARLFPGGEGRLVLTDPDDPRTTGIEVEAKPAGKKIRRLSLLSGGERSLTALAMLVAIFKARPSPFYVLDEVEAALDDTNLGRLLEIFKDLQRSSQLVIITHQKRTMEIADALYGVSMRGDGVSKVITQKIGSTTD